MIHHVRLETRRVRAFLLSLLAATSFLLYAAGVMMLRQDRTPGWAVEGAGGITAAASYLVYGTPFGAVDHNVEMKFVHPDGMSVQDILALAASKSIPPGTVDPTTIDGTGAGSDVFTIIAMAMFGMNVLSLILLYLVMMGIATVTFALRYRDKRLIVVPLYFLAVTFMLLTPLGSSADAVISMPAGGQRYFVLAAFLPALHIFFEIVDRSPPAGRKREIANSFLLLIQALLLLAALLVRSSTGYLVLILFVTWAWRLYRERSQRVPLRALLRKTVILACTSVIFAGIVVATLPAYLHSGRLFGNVWHRAFSTLSVHPDWPFGDLAKVYDCTKYIPQGLNRDAPDLNGQCVWLAYPPNAKRPFDDVVKGTYGGEYEKVVRQAYFYVLTQYPKQVFETYAFVKSGLIANVITAAWNDLFELRRAPVSNALFAVAAAQLLVFAASVALVAFTERIVIDRQMTIFPVFFVFSLVPLYVAMATAPTTLDTVFLMYSCLVLAALLLVQVVVQAALRRRPMRSAERS
jgi:hypothetical protein